MNGSSFRRSDGGCIDRSRSLSFIFDGRTYRGFAGDTLASALLANGVNLFGRSFKYHRPRGIYAAGVEEPNALVTLGTGNRQEPNIPATVIEVYDGLVAKSQNNWPSLKFDFMSITGLFSKIFSAGFYYKTFMGPTKKSWLFYEHFIRKAAGLGEAASEPDPDRYEKAYAFCDILIVGAGPSGLSAALAAGRAGARVILAEDDFELGGTLLTRSEKEVDQWLRNAITELESFPNVRIMNRTCVFGAYDNMVFGLVERVSDHFAVPQSFQPRQRYLVVHTRQAIIATGMVERPIVFGNNDLPGILLASAAQEYANRFSVIMGREIIVFTNNDSAYYVAIDLAHAGSNVSIVDVRHKITDDLEKVMRESGVTLYLGHAIAGANGNRCVESVDVMEFDHLRAAPDNIKYTLPCDSLLISGGWTPTLHLISQRGPKPVYDEKRAMLVVDSIPEGFHIAGSAASNISITERIMSGMKAGNSAAEACGFDILPGEVAFIEGLWGDVNDINTVLVPEVPDALGRKPRMKFVDFQNDVKTDDISLAHKEGYDSVELLKRYTTLGMATDQGKTSNFNALAILADKHGNPINEVGTTIFRPPFRAVTMGTLAGQETGLHFKPTRRSPMHYLHERNGAVFTQTGLWLRPWYFPAQGESCSVSSLREAENVRKKVGIVDISSLGKIDVQGPDAAEFLNRVYVNGWDNLRIGKARYGVMLRPDGIVFDDGTTSRLSEHHYFMTTTTGGAGNVMTFLEYLQQTAWSELKVHLTSVTSQWAAMAVAGPRSRDLLKSIINDVDFSNENFPFMGVNHGHIGEIPIRLIRLSFSGEMAYEVYTPAGYGEHVWQAICDQGRIYDIVQYGTEALGILRIEKGHVAGPEIDGRTTLADLGLSRMASNKKHFIGSTLMRREGMSDPNRPQLVGLVTANGHGKFMSGAILCEPGQHKGHGIGFVSSVTYSPELDKHIGLGFVSGGLSRSGEIIDAVFPLKDEVASVRITSPHFIDPDGKRLNA